MKAIVIGGGIGGLAAAIALQLNGIEAKVYERVPGLREVGAGLSLWGNAVRALKQLGVMEALGSSSMLNATVGIRTWKGQMLMAANTADMERRYGEPSVVLHRADLLVALANVLGEANVRLGMECTDFRQDASGVTAVFAGGHEARADLLVGADGLHSRVRAEIHGDQRPSYAGYTAWRAVVPFDPQRVTPGESWGAGARLGQVPMADGRLYWFATLNAPAGERSLDGEKALLLRVFGGWHEPIRDLIEATPDADILRNDIYDRPPLRWWGTGRVTLLGDAAHPMTPNLGQGACQALEDAVELGVAMRQAENVESALRAYEAARIPRTTLMVTQSRRLGAFAQWQNPAAVWLRGILMRTVMPHLQRRTSDRLISPQLQTPARPR